MRRPLLLPLVPVYWAALLLKGKMRGAAKNLQRPVISVGSLSAGGAGKTPVVIALADLLVRHGVAVDVLSRGYGRGSGVVERVDENGVARRFGDEPMLMARAGLEVYVGAERLQSGRLAEAEGDAMVHLLDDGFQHRRLARTLDVVLLTKEDADDWLLPAGNLREPLSALRRAQVVVLREEEADGLRDLVRRKSSADVWVARRELILPERVPQRMIAFCGLARPEGFFSFLKKEGCDLVGTHAFGDHHPYERSDIEQLCAAGAHAGADGFVTTTKDAAKLSPAMREMLEEVGELVIADVRVRFLDEDAVWRRCLA